MFTKMCLITGRNLCIESDESTAGVSLKFFPYMQNGAIAGHRIIVSGEDRDKVSHVYKKITNASYKRS